MRWILLLFLIIPALEIGLFVWIGGIIGPLWVVFLIIGTGILGIAIAKFQGMETLKRAQLQMRNGYAPTTEIVDGICIFIGAVFLFTPGFITDITGFILVLPWTRIPFRGWVYRVVKNKMSKGTIIYRR